MLKGEKPNCTRTVCRNAVGESCVWLICATTTSGCNSRRNVSMSVVLPAPISPVITTKPSVNQMVDSMYALARACCLLKYRNCGSGLRRNGNSWSLKSSKYMISGSLRDRSPVREMTVSSPLNQLYCFGERQIALRCAALEDGTVTQFAPRARLLAIVMKSQPLD